MKQKYQMKTPWHYLWDAWCILSIVGIWPRFIEPNLLCVTRKQLSVPNLPKRLSGFSILHLSDLHFSDQTSNTFLQKISNTISLLAPDVIVFTGDLVSFSHVEDEQRLLAHLKTWQAPFGTYAILGNHDYASYVSLGQDKSYYIVEEPKQPLFRGFARLFSSEEQETLPLVTTPLEPHPAIVELYKQAGIRLLHNETVLVGFGNNLLNIVGLGDIMTLQCKPECCQATLSPQLPTIVLSHNPDSFSKIEQLPGDLFLFGHTHGGQVNLPWMWKKVTPLVDTSLKSGFIHRNGKSLFISRGLGSPFPFRWFAPPQISYFQLVPEPIVKEHDWSQATKLQAILQPPKTCPTARSHNANVCTEDSL